MTLLVTIITELDSDPALQLTQRCPKECCASKVVNYKLVVAGCYGAGAGRKYLMTGRCHDLLVKCANGN